MMSAATILCPFTANFVFLGAHCDAIIYRRFSRMHIVETCCVSVIVSCRHDDRRAVHSRHLVRRVDDRLRRHLLLRLRSPLLDQGSPDVATELVYKS